MKNTKQRKVRNAPRWKAPLSREALARRLKAAVVVVACILGVALGIGSAVMSQALFASAQPEGPGRSVSIGDLQRIIEVQAEASIAAPPQSAPLGTR